MNFMQFLSLQRAELLDRLVRKAVKYDSTLIFDLEDTLYDIEGVKTSEIKAWGRAELTRFAHLRNDLFRPKKGRRTDQPFRQQIRGPRLACFHGTVILTTCNRTEIYFTSDDLPVVQRDLLQFFAQEGADSCYTYLEFDCVFHLCRVVSGFDSAILGETEIQHQVKCAYQESCKLFPLSAQLHFLFQKALKVGKLLRSTYPHVRGMETLERVLWAILQKHGVEISRARTLFVGASKTNRALFTYFRSKGMQEADLCSKYPNPSSTAKGGFL